MKIDNAIQSSQSEASSFSRHNTIRLAILIFGSMIYQSALIFILQYEKSLTIIVAGLIPIVCVLAFKRAQQNARIVQLLAIEYFFMSLCILSIFAIRMHFDQLLPYFGVLFVGWFFLQVGGFIQIAIKRRDAMAIAVTLISFTNVLLWLASFSHLVPALGQDRLMYLWGKPEPIWIIAAYMIWACYILTVMQSLPKLIALVEHVISILLSAISGEFFFARLLTASNLFLIDYFIDFSRKDLLGRSFLILDEHYYATSWQRHRRTIGYVCCVAQMAISYFAVKNLLG